MSVLVLDSDDYIIYVGTTKEDLPASLRDVDEWGVRGQYRNIAVDYPVVWGNYLKAKWNGYEVVETVKPSEIRPQLSMDPSTDGSATLMKENENLKQRIIEQERQLNLIRSHLGL